MSTCSMRTCTGGSSRPQREAPRCDCLLKKRQVLGCPALPERTLSGLQMLSKIASSSLATVGAGAPLWLAARLPAAASCDAAGASLSSPNNDTRNSRSEASEVCTHASMSLTYRRASWACSSMGLGPRVSACSCVRQAVSGNRLPPRQAASRARPRSLP